jgi:hypothetical protein
LPRRPSKLHQVLNDQQSYKHMLYTMVEWGDFASNVYP